MEAKAPNQKYILAQIAVLEIERRITKLANEGNHKLKNKIINSDLMKATQKRNKAARTLLTELNTIAAFTENASARYDAKERSKD